MKRNAPLLLAILLLLLVATASISAQDAPAEVSMVGTWRLYRVNTLADFTINEYRNRVATQSLSEAELVLNDDGTLETDSPKLRFTEWRMEDGFLIFVSETGNGFYVVRDLTEQVYFLVSLTVTERNRRVTDIRTNPSGNLVLVRQE